MCDHEPQRISEEFYTYQYFKLSLHMESGDFLNVLVCFYSFDEDLDSESFILMSPSNLNLSHKRTAFPKGLETSTSFDPFLHRRIGNTAVESSFKKMRHSSRQNSFKVYAFTDSQQTAEYTVQ